ncbi:MAG TPA: hypothetical protein VKF61_00965 [Candidatus Polarisedimenticolia bacterium]|nr:hypothetical protein [Candidatus Polarisedimenticolia bacterium]
MGRALQRLGGVLIVAAVVYLAAAQILSGDVNRKLFLIMAASGGVSLALGFLLSIAGRGMAAMAGRSCPRCGRRVAPGRVYCEEHLQETINEYRDQQRNRGG